MDSNRLATADELAAIRADREPKYGPHKENHVNIGLAWSGLLQAAGWTPPDGTSGVAPDVVELMAAAVKLVRAANYRSGFLADNYDDAVNYTQMAGEVKGGIARG